VRPRGVYLGGVSTRRDNPTFESKLFSFTLRGERFRAAPDRAGFPVRMSALFTIAFASQL
jgi:hypothetical protein